MAWIEVHQQLPRHPKTWRLAHDLGIGVPEAVGHLVCLWLWGLDFAGADGDLSEYSPEFIAKAGEWGGDPGEFVAALRAAGYIDPAGKGLALHDWADYAGRLNETRAKNAERQRAYREKQKEAKGKKRKAPTPKPATPTPADPDFDEFWRVYPRAAAKTTARRVWAARMKEGEDAATIIRGARHYGDYCRALRTEEQFIKMPATFIGPDRHYLDWLTPKAIQQSGNGKGLSAEEIASFFDDEPEPDTDVIEGEVVA